MSLQVGDRVTFNGGFHGTVTRIYSPGMVEVRGERGTVCIPNEDCVLLATKPQHAPGPWEIHTSDDERFEVHPQGDSHGLTVIADVFTPSNARLIAAAPLLLEALRKALNTLAYIRQVSDYDEDSDGYSAKRIHAASLDLAEDGARAAIRAAEGGVTERTANK